MKIHEVQIVRKIVLSVAILVGVLVFALTNSNHPSGETVHEMIEWTGIVAIVICVLGRTWTSLYIGGRKIEQLVTEGPYSVTRNPLYFFSILGAAGAGAQLGSVVSGLIFGVLAWVVFYVVVLQEERVLAARHGADFAGYMGRVPRFWAKSSAVARRTNAHCDATKDSADLRRRNVLCYRFRSRRASSISKASACCR